jgi:ABC-type Fe3+ transport system permease subunit
MIFTLLSPLFVLLALFFVVLFLVFKSCARRSYRVTRRNPEDEQPWQYTISVLAAWLPLLGVVVFVLLAVVSWAN